MWVHAKPSSHLDAFHVNEFQVLIIIAAMAEQLLQEGHQLRGVVFVRPACACACVCVCVCARARMMIMMTITLRNRIILRNIKENYKRNITENYKRS